MYCCLFSREKMFRVNKLTILLVITLNILAFTTASSIPTQLNGSNSTDGRSNSNPKDSGTGAGAAAAVATGCFSSDTLVTLTNQKRVLIQQLRPGDQLLTTDGSTIFTTQMMMMLDKNRFSQTMFHTIVTASGHHVSLTELHLIPIIENNYTINYIPAKQVKSGDVVYVMSDGQLMTSTVTDVILEMKTGYYAPLTTSGTLLANDIMTSCYANVQSHEAAQFYMAPLRWYHQIAQFLSINEPFGHQKVDGIHIIPHIMYEFGRFFRPTTLRLS